MHHLLKLLAVFFAGACLLSCQQNGDEHLPEIRDRDSLPLLKTVGVSTLISDSGIIRYKIIAEEWSIYDKRTPPHWAFPKGLFIERFDENFHVEAFITADTAYYFNVDRLWELHGRVEVKNLKGETFRTSLLYWDLNKKLIYSPRYMEIDGIENQLSGYNFSSNESMTEYRIHSSKGAFPVSESSSAPPPLLTASDMLADTTDVAPTKESNAPAKESNAKAKDSRAKKK